MELKLFEIISIKMYLELYTILYSFQLNYHMFCFCQDVPGCPNRFGNRNHCLICQFHWSNDIDHFEAVKKNPLKLISFFFFFFFN